MSYINLINSFWHFYDENKEKLSASDIVLFKVLLRYANKTGWQSPFFVDPFLMSQINPLSQKTYYKSMANLHALGLIVWKKGKHNVDYQKVTIGNFTVSTTVSLSGSLNTSIANSPTDSLTNNNKTNRLKDLKTVRQLETEDFSSLIQSESFLNFLKENNYKLIKQKSVNLDFNSILHNFKINCPNLSQPATLTKARKGALTARASEHSEQAIIKVFQIVSKSKFLNGDNGSGWKANFDWIIKSSNFVKILEGNYNNSAPQQTFLQKEEKPKFILKR